MNVLLGITNTITCGFGNATNPRILKKLPRIDLQWHLLHSLFLVCFSFLDEGEKEMNQRNRVRCKSAASHHTQSKATSVFKKTRGILIPERSSPGGAGWGRWPFCFCWLPAQCRQKNRYIFKCLTERKSRLHHQLLATCFPLTFLKLVCCCALFYFMQLVKDFSHYLEIAHKGIFS